MMADTLSPEERLFKVIQQGKLAAGRAGSGGEKKTGGWFGGFKRFTAPQAAGLKEVVPGWLRWPEFEPENINRVLAVIFIVLVFAVYAASAQHKNVSVIAEVAARNGSPPGADKKTIEPLKEFSFYLKGIQRRDIFRAGTEAPAVESAPLKDELMTKASADMKLQGISWGDVPKAMILWQKGKDSKMYFLVEGQAIGTTGYKVIKILKSTVKIGNGIEETTLL